MVFCLLPLLLESIRLLLKKMFEKILIELALALKHLLLLVAPEAGLCMAAQRELHRSKRRDTLECNRLISLNPRRTSWVPLAPEEIQNMTSFSLA